MCILSDGDRPAHSYQLRAHSCSSVRLRSRNLVGVAVTSRVADAYVCLCGRDALPAKQRRPRALDPTLAEDSRT